MPASVVASGVSRYGAGSPAAPIVITNPAAGSAERVDVFGRDSLAITPATADAPGSECTARRNRNATLGFLAGAALGWSKGGPLVAVVAGLMGLVVGMEWQTCRVGAGVPLITNPQAGSD